MSLDKRSLKKILVESINNQTIGIQPKDIYNFYYLNYLLSDRRESAGLDVDQINSAKYEVGLIRNIYLKSFVPVIQSQLKKYLNRERIDRNAFTMADIATDNYETLDRMMKKTYRSDMKRRNDRWEYLTSALSGLQKTKESKQVMYFIDRINNAMHNAQESIMVKFPNGDDLITALSDSHRLNPQQLKSKISDLSFLNEDAVGKAYVFDVDDTLIRSQSKINVYNNGQLVRKLDPKEFNTYKKNKDEVFDFSEFDKFIEPKKYKAWPILKNINEKIKNGKSDSVIYILTARASGIVDDLLNLLSKNGITSIDRSNIFTVGDKAPGKTVAERKKEVLEQIKTNHDGNVEFFDDADDNIELAKAIGIKTRHITESEVEPIGADAALKMAVGPVGIKSGKAFIWDKFKSDNFFIGSSISGHKPLISQLNKKTSSENAEDAMLRGYWFNSNGVLVLYPYMQGSSTREPNEDEVNAILSKMNISPNGIYVVRDNMLKEETLNIKFEVSPSQDKKKIINSFVQYILDNEKIKSSPEITLQNGRGDLRTTAVYSNKDKYIRVNAKDRALVDILRSLAHELIHHKQSECGDLDKTAHQDIGGPVEDEANARAGSYLKQFAKDTGMDIYADTSSLDIDNLIDKNLNEVLSEGYITGSYEYNLPKDKEEMLYDFYMSTLLFPPPNEGPSARIRPGASDELNYAVERAKTRLNESLKQELLDATFYSLAAEIRHFKDRNKWKDAERLLPPEQAKVMKKYMTKMVAASEAGIPPTRRGKVNRNLLGKSDYDTSYKAALSADPKKETIVKAMQTLYEKGEWASMYGGDAWAKIAKAWTKLNDAKDNMHKMIWIDHVYDLQHNTDTVFNKISSYTKNGSYSWLKKALDYKFKIKDPFELWNKISDSMRSLAAPAVKAWTGNTLEEFAKKNRGSEITNVATGELSAKKKKLIPKTTTDIQPTHTKVPPKSEWIEKWNSLARGDYVTLIGTKMPSYLGEKYSVVMNKPGWIVRKDTHSIVVAYNKTAYNGSDGEEPLKSNEIKWDLGEIETGKAIFQGLNDGGKEKRLREISYSPGDEVKLADHIGAEELKKIDMPAEAIDKLLDQKDNNELLGVVSSKKETSHYDSMGEGKTISVDVKNSHQPTLYFPSSYLVSMKASSSSSPEFKVGDDVKIKKQYLNRKDLDKVGLTGTSSILLRSTGKIKSLDNSSWGYKGFGPTVEVNFIKTKSTASGGLDYENFHIPQSWLEKNASSSSSSVKFHVGDKIKLKDSVSSEALEKIGIVTGLKDVINASRDGNLVIEKEYNNGNPISFAGMTDTWYIVKPFLYKLPEKFLEPYAEPKEKKNQYEGIDYSHYPTLSHSSEVKRGDIVVVNNRVINKDNINCVGEVVSVDRETDNAEIKIIYSPGGIHGCEEGTLLNMLSFKLNLVSHKNAETPKFKIGESVQIKSNVSGDMLNAIGIEIKKSDLLRASKNGELKIGAGVNYPKEKTIFTNNIKDFWYQLQPIGYKLPEKYLESIEDKKDSKEGGSKSKKETSEKAWPPEVGEELTLDLTKPEMLYAKPHDLPASAIKGIKANVKTVSDIGTITIEFKRGGETFTCFISEEDGPGNYFAEYQKPEKLEYTDSNGNKISVGDKVQLDVSRKDAVLSKLVKDNKLEFGKVYNAEQIGSPVGSTIMLGVKNPDGKIVSLGTGWWKKSDIKETPKDTTSSKKNDEETIKTQWSNLKEGDPFVIVDGDSEWLGSYSSVINKKGKIIKITNPSEVLVEYDPKDFNVAIGSVKNQVKWLLTEVLDSRIIVQGINDFTLFESIITKYEMTGSGKLGSRLKKQKKSNISGRRVDKGSCGALHERKMPMKEMLRRSLNASRGNITAKATGNSILGKVKKVMSAKGNPFAKKK
jgi:hypothetical protein